MNGSSEQFRWIKPNGVLQSETLDNNYFPFGFAFNGNLMECRSAFNFGPLEGMSCNANNFRAWIATVEGFIERYVLAMMIDGDGLHERLRNPANKPYELDLSESVISVRELADPNYRENFTRLPRRWSNRLFRSAVNLMNSFRADYRFDDFKQRYILSLSMTDGTFEWNFWRRDLNVTAGTFFKEFKLEEEDYWNILAADFKFLYDDYLTFKHCDTTLTWWDYIPYSIHLYNVLADWWGITLDNWYGLSDDSHNGGLEEFLRYGRAGYDTIQNWSYSSNPLIKKIIEELGSTITDERSRLNAFYWGAMNSLIDRMGVYGAQLMTDWYYAEEVGQLQKKYRQLFTVERASRDITLLIQWNPTIQDFEASYSAPIARWDKYGDFNYGRNSWLESHSENVGADSTAQLGFKFHYNIRQMAQLFVGKTAAECSAMIQFLGDSAEFVVSPDYPIYDSQGSYTREFETQKQGKAVLHIHNQGLIDFLERYRDDIETSVESENEAYFVKSYNSFYTDTTGTPRVDVSGLEDYPCQYAKYEGYVAEEAFAYAFGRLKLYRGTFDPLNDNNVDGQKSEDSVNIAKASFNILEGGMEGGVADAAKKSIADLCYGVEKIAENFGWRIIGQKDRLLATMNGFRFGNGTADYFLEKAREEYAANPFVPEEMYWDIYFDFQNDVCVGIDMIATAHDYTSNPYPSDDYFRYSWREDEPVVVVATKQINISSEPSQEDDLDNYEARLTVPATLITHDWKWKAIVN